ncbi:transcriptional regulator with PAS, ATPase and Fis domain [Pseudomonas sp. URMO17WK12:I10]|uniref:sigma-54 interaction domain-containing protein n=1 Tax=Pseudomonas TaxID=286 RepID=UPI000489E590|nr:MULTISPECIES: sigma-54-dependent Fis family transcriptional regulator [unclassified Pseudomonas]RDL25796.1 transcriptional regulator with PAS, ATPase and Fis domain [Pseudomonas sp. LAMO17WK12:I3]RED14562.1 transcriptional regulator with PAS, ATPase and Fis domain [Pseudomonas sp. URMO17WK12:I10]CRN06105.1 Transcriptional regulatory protein ZraR [Pseudomonas sp. URMO17WK12:I11]SOD07747.1 sigma54 specific transcriptional regulator, Fis family [Pseudomonas sp. URMO17WK12:I9]
MSEPHPSVLALVSFLEHDVLPAIVLDTDYNILAANTAYRRQFGQDQQAPLGQKCHKVSHHYHVPCDQAGEDCPMRKAWSSKVPERVLHVHHTPRGPEHVDVELRPILDEQGRVIAFVERLTRIVIASAQPQEQGLVGQAPAFTAALASLQRAAPAAIPVLLQGESGTGKELFARALHMGSPKADGPLVVVDCTSLTEALFESELFGYEKGAFTGAHQRKTGLAEAAHGGTLFLDEIGEVPLAMQVKLLRLIETGSFRPVGSLRTVHSDFRLVSATHKPLRQMVADGTFREDLYYRISGFPIRMPALRERIEDLPLLVQSLLKRIAGPSAPTLGNAALDRLMTYPFPGNIRELRNILERARLFADEGVIQPEHLPEDVVSLPAQVRAHGSRPADLLQVLSQFRGSRSELAKHLGISERTLYRRLKAAGIAEDH